MYLCVVEKEDRIKGFAQLGALMRALGRAEQWKDFSWGVTEEEYLKLEELVQRQSVYNGWFTPANVRRSLLAQGEWLYEDRLAKWLESTPYAQQVRTVALIMAGNIPLVGFHDFLCVLLSGHSVVCKLSSDDKTLLPALANHLMEFTPELKEKIVFTTGRISEMHAVIATGSNNSTLYFQQYFGKYPHIFRHNRSSVAVLDGTETKEELAALGDDIFSYFGLGCRNVTHMLLPVGFELSRFFEGIFSFSDVVFNKKYGNNYDYHKAIFLLNKHNLLDNNFVLLRETEELFSPLSMVHYHFYSDPSEAEEYVFTHEKDIQVVVGHGYVPFGKAQAPQLTDYADGVDVLAWLADL
ncbi:MAG: hypothetical protein A3D92_05910 [Bacteroidetes bacterium RIFCSPHIGHO2_02_FULL_44_7]|nr:MAG: hypothetical protein A3D92_05910 [Bacteroidetes bacterium RIFCSPHIGHO2_02_FULL_44_7]